MAAAVARDRFSEEHDELLGGGMPFAGKYAVERILGIGGMGTVFEARHIRLGHRVAIKVLGSELRDYPELVTRFEREARAAGSLSSRHAVRVFDIDMTEDATPFIVMELLSGQDLARVVEREGPQPVERAVRWVIEACDAIAEAHSLGIVHRDLKPSNLFLTAEGVKVLDFGIAKRVAAKEASITHSVAPLGTPQYMSPEQVRCAKDVDTRTDVWSLGVTLYELVTGKTPFAHEIPQACIASVVADPVPDPRTLRADLPSGLVDVIMKALKKDPAERFASVPELVQALAPFALIESDEEPSTAVRRVIDNAGRAMRSAESTLDGEQVPAKRSSAVPPELLESGVRPSRAPMDSKSSLPAAVTKIPSVPPSPLRSRFAIVGAAVLGLAAIVVTPKCVGRVDARSPAKISASAPAPTMKVEPVAVATATGAELRDEKANETETENENLARNAPAVAAEPEKPVVAPAVAKKPVPAATTTSSSSSRSLLVKPARPAEPRIYGDNSPVHGGLSNPGF